MLTESTHSMTRRAEAHDYARPSAHRCLPVVCHRRDKARFAEQKARCLEEAQAGTLLVSPRIAKGEQEIIGEAITVPECKTMNCVAQALCRTKEDWWG